MELEGLIRCLKKVEEEGVVISDLVTDRHSQIKAYMKKKGQISIIGLMCGMWLKVTQFMLYNCYITVPL